MFYFCRRKGFSEEDSLFLSTESKQTQEVVELKLHLISVQLQFNKNYHCEIFVLACPDACHVVESDCDTRLVVWCAAVVVQLHHGAIVELKALMWPAHVPAGAACFLIKCAFQ